MGENQIGSHFNQKWIVKNRYLPHNRNATNYDKFDVCKSVANPHKKKNQHIKSPITARADGNAPKKSLIELSNILTDHLTYRLEKLGELHQELKSARSKKNNKLHGILLATVENNCRRLKMFEEMEVEKKKKKIYQ